MPDKKLQMEVWEAEGRRRLAMLNGDLTTLNNILSDALIYTHSTGMMDSKESWLAKISDGSLRYEILDFTDPKFILLSETVLIVAKMNATVVRCDLKSSFVSLYMAVWSKTSTIWQLVAIQATPLK